MPEKLILQDAGVFETLLPLLRACGGDQKCAAGIGPCLSKKPQGAASLMRRNYAEAYLAKASAAVFWAPMLRKSFCHFAENANFRLIFVRFAGKLRFAVVYYAQVWVLQRFCPHVTDRR